MALFALYVCGIIAHVVFNQLRAPFLLPCLAALRCFEGYGTSCRVRFPGTVVIFFFFIAPVLDLVKYMAAGAKFSAYWKHF